MKYNIQTTSDHSYFAFLKIFVNSILTNCNLEYLNKIYIINQENLKKLIETSKFDEYNSFFMDYY